MKYHQRQEYLQEICQECFLYHKIHIPTTVAEQNSYYMNNTHVIIIYYDFKKIVQYFLITIEYIVFILTFGCMHEKESSRDRTAMIVHCIQTVLYLLIFFVC